MTEHLLDKVERQNKIIPKAGIYAVYVLFNDVRYKAMLYIGNRPTLNGQDQSIEVNLFDATGEYLGSWEQNNGVIDLTNYANGIYFLEFIFATHQCILHEKLF